MKLKASRCQQTMQTFSCPGGQTRSTLSKLSKREIVSGIIDKTPTFGWARITAYLKLSDMRDITRDIEARFNRVDKLRLEQQVEKCLELKAVLLKVNRDLLVEMSYWMSDNALNYRYGSRQATLRQAPVLLKEERAIDLSKRQIDTLLKRAQRKGYDPKVKTKKIKPAKKVVLTLRQARQAAKVKTLSWIQSIKSHLSYMAQDSDTLSHTA